jgi:hypothetical protein
MLSGLKRSFGTAEKPICVRIREGARQGESRRAPHTLRIALGGKTLASKEVTNAFDDNTPTPAEVRENGLEAVQRLQKKKKKNSRKENRTSR